MVEKKTLIGTVDLTPKWVDVLELLVENACCNSPERVALARDELTRMAQAADAYNAMQSEIARAKQDIAVSLPRLIPTGRRGR